MVNNFIILHPIDAHTHAHNTAVISAETEISEKFAGLHINFHIGSVKICVFLANFVTLLLWDDNSERIAKYLSSISITSIHIILRIMEDTSVMLSQLSGFMYATCPQIMIIHLPKKYLFCFPSWKSDVVNEQDKINNAHADTQPVSYHQTVIV